MANPRYARGSYTGPTSSATFSGDCCRSEKGRADLGSVPQVILPCRCFERVKQRTVGVQLKMTYPKPAGRHRRGDHTPQIDSQARSQAFVLLFLLPGWNAVLHMYAIDRVLRVIHANRADRLERPHRTSEAAYPLLGLLSSCVRASENSSPRKSSTRSRVSASGSGFSAASSAADSKRCRHAAAWADEIASRTRNASTARRVGRQPTRPLDIRIGLGQTDAMACRAMRTLAPEQAQQMKDSPLLQ